MYRDSTTKHIILFFTYGVSLREWVEKGLISREIKLYQSLIQDGYRVTFITYGDRTDWEFDEMLKGIEVIPVYELLKRPGNRWIRLLQSFLLPLFLRNVLNDADFYKTNQMSGSWVPVIAKLLNRKPLLVRCGFEMMRNMLRNEASTMKRLVTAAAGYMIELCTYLAADRIVISNFTDFNFIKRYFPINTAKIEVVRNFVDTELFSPNECNTDKKKKTNHTALYIGRIIDRKNIAGMIKAFVETPYSLDLVGGGDTNQFLKLVPGEMGGRIRFLGVFPNHDIPDILQKYDVFILPSLFENNPKTLIEAMSCGKVVIGTNVDGIRELIVDGSTGILCGTDTNSIRVAITKAFAMTASEKSRMGENARRFIIQHCSFGSVYRKEIALYSALDCFVTH